MSLTRQPYKGVKRQKIEIRLPVGLISVIDQKAGLDGVSRTQKITDYLEQAIGGKQVVETQEVPQGYLVEQILKCVIETNYIASTVYGNSKGRMTSNLASEASAVAKKKILEIVGNQNNDLGGNV
jgi:hypothetical protein